MILLFPISAVIALVPAAILSWRRPRRDGLMLALIGVAAAGPASWAVVLMGDGWRTGLGPALWVSLAVTALEFLALAASSREGWRLAPLALPYMIVLGLLALLVQTPDRLTIPADVPGVWLDLHILVSVITYGLVGLAAVASLAVLVQERALKLRRGAQGITAQLPSLAAGERLEFGLLMAAEAVLAAGILTGAAADWYATAEPAGFGHKTVFAVLAFLVIGAILLAHRRTGLRGRRAARLALLAWLLLTLAYPGVKVVTDLILV